MNAISRAYFDVVSMVTFGARAALARTLCRWITEDDRERVRRTLVEAADLVEEIAGVRPDLRGIPIEPAFLLRANPRAMIARVSIEGPGRRMRLVVNFAIGRRRPDELFVVLAHEVAHILHEQVHGISREKIEEAERFAYVATLAAGDRRSCTFEVAHDVRAPHWRAWKWCRDRSSEDRVAWAREFIAAHTFDGPPRHPLPRPPGRTRLFARSAKVRQVATTLSAPRTRRHRKHANVFNTS